MQHIIVLLSRTKLNWTEVRNEQFHIVLDENVVIYVCASFEFHSPVINLLMVNSKTASIRLWMMLAFLI